MASLNWSIFRNNWVLVCSSAGPKILVFGSHSSTNFQPILDCFIPNFKLKYEDSENMKADRANTVFVNLYQIKGRAFILGYPAYKYRFSNYSRAAMLTANANLAYAET